MAAGTAGGRNNEISGEATGQIAVAVIISHPHAFSAFSVTLARNVLSIPKWMSPS
jgi:hypothetical protein